jgi:hypothetical protein
VTADAPAAGRIRQAPTDGNLPNDQHSVLGFAIGKRPRREPKELFNGLAPGAGSAQDALRVMAPSFQPGWDVLIIARPAIVKADQDALVGALGRVLRSGGVLGGRTDT